MRDGWLSQERLRDPSLTVFLFAQLFVIFVATPIAACGTPIPPLVVGLVTFVLLGVIVLVSPSRAAMSTVLVLVALTWIATGARERQPSALTAWLAASTGVLAWGAVGAVVLAAVFGPGRITHFRIQGAVVLYLAFGLIFAELYRLVHFVRPDAFNGVHAATDAESVATMTYFSLTTLTSTGFGDIVPVHPSVRSLANLEAVVGQLYPATVVARLITLELADRRR